MASYTDADYEPPEVPSEDEPGVDGLTRRQVRAVNNAYFIGLGILIVLGIVALVANALVR